MLVYIYLYMYMLYAYIYIYILVFMTCRDCIPFFLRSHQCVGGSSGGSFDEFGVLLSPH